MSRKKIEGWVYFSTHASDVIAFKGIFTFVIISLS